MRRKYNSGYLLFRGLGAKHPTSLHRKLTRRHFDQVGLFLGCVSCHSSTEVFFLQTFARRPGTVLESDRYVRWHP